MGRAGWGVVFMTLIALAVAISGLMQGNTMESTIAENPTLDQLYTYNENYTTSENGNFDDIFYGFVEGDEDIAEAGTEDFYTASWSNTKQVLNFLKNFIAPATILRTIPSLKEYPASIVIWVVNIIWGILYGLLLFEVIWRYDIFG